MLTASTTEEDRVQHCLLVETFSWNGRFHVRLKRPSGSNFAMPRANYIWLLGNPSFRTIPRGYVIHHLDGDKTNDDITNVVLMYKLHHSAHHLKKITSTVNVHLEYDLSHYPQPWLLKRKPTIVKINIRTIRGEFKPRLALDFSSYHVGRGKDRVRIRLLSWNGITIASEEMALMVAEEIWAIFGFGGLKASEQKLMEGMA